MTEAALNVLYQFTVRGTEVTVVRDGHPIPETFSAYDEDTVDRPSPLHKFLESIGRSEKDAHIICEQVEKGQSVRGVMGSK